MQKEKQLNLLVKPPTSNIYKVSFQTRSHSHITQTNKKKLMSRISREIYSPGENTPLQNKTKKKENDIYQGLQLLQDSLIWMSTKPSRSQILNCSWSLLFPYQRNLPLTFVGSSLSPLLLNHNGFVSRTLTEKTWTLCFPLNINSIHMVIFLIKLAPFTLLCIHTNRTTNPKNIPSITIEQWSPKRVPIHRKHFNLCISTKIYSHHYECTIVCPIPKKTTPSNPANYHPNTFPPSQK